MEKNNLKKSLRQIGQLSKSRNKKPKIIIIGTGNGNDLKSLTLESYWKIMKAKEIYCRIDFEPIIQKLKEKKKEVISLTSFYKRYGSFDKTYKNMARFLIKEAREKGEILYLVPGHPFVCEYPTELVIKMAEQSGIGIQVLSNLSFLDSLFVDARFEPGLGMQFTAASELFKEKIYKSFSPDLVNVIACLSNKLQPGRKMTVYDKFIEFLRNKFYHDQKISIVYQDPYSFRQEVILTKVGEIKKYKQVLTTCRATCVIFPKKRP